MNVYVYIGIYIHIYIYIYIYIHVFTCYICFYRDIFTYTHVMFLCIHTYSFFVICFFVYLCVYVCIFANIHVFAVIHIPLHVHGPCIIQLVFQMYIFSVTSGAHHQRHSDGILRCPSPAYGMSGALEDHTHNLLFVVQ